MIFTDRYDAGRKLAKRLKGLGKDVVVEALPRGGTAVGFEISKQLHVPLDVLVVRKIGMPFNPEYGVGAVTARGHSYLDTDRIKKSGVPKESIEGVLRSELAEAKRREKLYMSGRRHRQIRGKTVILTDDGLATGVTVNAALLQLKNMHPKAVILAVPGGPADTINALMPLVASVVVLDKDSSLISVGQLYSKFPQLSDRQVVALLNKSCENIKKPL